jgi:Na+/proline symporter
VQDVNWTALIIFVLLFAFITWLGFAAANWRRGDLDLLHEWGLGGRRFGTVVTWFLVGGDLYTAYTFIAVPALAFGAGAVAFFAVPYTIVAYPIFSWFSRASGTSATSATTSRRAISCAAALAIAGWRWRSQSPVWSRRCRTSPCSSSACRW